MTSNRHAAIGGRGQGATAGNRAGHKARLARIRRRHRHRVNRVGLVLGDFDAGIILVQMAFAVLVVGVPRPVVADGAVQGDDRAIKLAHRLGVGRAQRVRKIRDVAAIVSD